MWLAEKNIANDYIKSVNVAISNSYFYETFKSNANYNSIVGMSTENQAHVWYENIKTNYPTVYDNLLKFAKNDSIGSPKLWTSKDGITISPNTLRYVNTCIEIKDFFNFDNDITVSELGIGYGGLCFIFNQFFNVSKYILLDLPEVQKLAEKYLKDLDVNNTCTNFEDSDLFISEFCLSEFDDDDLYNFYETYIKRSKNIYLHMNLHEENRKFRFLNTLSNDFSFVIADEFPKTHWPNYVVKGTKKI